MKVINPVNGNLEKTYENDNTTAVRQKVERAQQQYLKWKGGNINRRAELMVRAAEVIESHKEIFARLMTTEMGKLYRDAIAEVGKCAWVCRYYAAHAKEFLGN